MLAKLDTNTFVSNKANMKSSLAKHNVSSQNTFVFLSLDPNKPENY